LGNLQELFGKGLVISHKSSGPNSEGDHLSASQSCNIDQPIEPTALLGISDRASDSIGHHESTFCIGIENFNGLSAKGRD
jgi:hypothetical protein